MNFKITMPFFAVVILVLFTGCNGPKPATESPKPITSKKGKTPPLWIANRPIDANYYIGIAVASKATFPTSFALVAQNNALNEMAGQIDVQVKSNSMLFSFEDNGKFTDEYKEFVQVKANQQLTNYEQVDAWENELEYWVYYRLSKEQFQKDKQQKIDQATNLSLTSLAQAQKQEEQGNLNSAMRTYFDALVPIKPYLGEPLNVMYNGQNIYLGNYLFDKIATLSYSYEIEPLNPKIEKVWGGSVSFNDLSFRVTDAQKKPISGMMVQFSYSEGVIRPRENATNSYGEVYTEINKISTTKNLQEVAAYVDFQSLIMGNKAPDEITKAILKRLHKPSANISIQVVAPTIFVKSNEKKLEKGKNGLLQKAFINQASLLGFKIVDSQKLADLIVDISVETQRLGVSNNLYNSALIGSISIKDRSQNIVYQENLKNLKGVSSSYEKASDEAYKKAMEFISEKVVPRFYRKYLS